MRKSVQENLEPIYRPLKDFAYDGEIVGIFGATVHVRLAGAGRKLVQNVRLADHIRKEALFVGLKCKIKGLRERTGGVRGSKILTDIMPQHSGASFAYAFIPQAPLVYVSVNCQTAEWLVNWDNVDGADAYELYWAKDDEGAAEELITTTLLREEEVPFDDDEPPRIYFAVRAVSGLKKGPYSAWVTDPNYLGSMPLVSFGDEFNHGHVLNIGSLYRANIDDEVEWSTDEGDNWAVIADEDLPALGVSRQRITQVDSSFIYTHRHSARYRPGDAGVLELSTDSELSWITRRPETIISPWGDEPAITDVDFIQILSQETLIEVAGEGFNSGDLSISAQLARSELDKDVAPVIEKVGGGLLADDNTNYRVDFFRGRVFLFQDGSSDAEVEPDADYEIDYSYKKRRWIILGRWLDGAAHRSAIWRSDDQYGRVWTQYDLRNSAESELQVIWAAINSTKLLLTCWADGKLWLYVHDAQTLDFEDRYDFATCTLEELEAKNFILYPATVEDDAELYHVFGRTRHLPTDWAVFDNGFLLPSSVYDIDDDADNVYFLSSPANGNDIDMYTVSTQTHDRLASDGTFQEDPSDDPHIPNLGSRNVVAFFNGDLYALIANDKLNAGGGVYGQVWRYDGTPFNWTKVWESPSRANDDPWAFYSDGTHLMLAWTDDVYYTSDGSTWNGPETIPDVWSQTNQDTSLPMTSTQRMGMTITPKVYGNHPVQWWGLDDEMSTTPGSAEYYLYKFAGGSVTTLIADWGNVGDDFPNIHCADSERIWRQNGGNYEYTTDTEVDGSSVWTQPTLGHIRPIPTYGLSGYSVGLDVSTREFYVLDDASGQWVLDGTLEANPGSTTYEPVGCWRMADGETYIVITADNERIIYKRDITLPDHEDLDLSQNYVAKSEDAGETWESIADPEEWDGGFCSALYVGPDADGRRYIAHREEDDG